MIGETETLGETVPRTCPVCGDEPVAIVHDTGKAARPYEVTGGYCTVRDTEVDTAHIRDRQTVLRPRLTGVRSRPRSPPMAASAADSSGP